MGFRYSLGGEACQISVMSISSSYYGQGNIPDAFVASAFLGTATQQSGKWQFHILERLNSRPL